MRDRWLGAVPRARHRRGLGDRGRKTPYEVRFSSPVGEEIDVMSVHVAVDRYFAALRAVYPNRASEVEVIDFFGRDKALAHLSKL